MVVQIYVVERCLEPLADTYPLSAIAADSARPGAAGH
jgi:hypothetical protein